MKILEISNIKYVSRLDIKKFVVLPKILMDYIIENKKDIDKKYLLKIINIYKLIVMMDESPLNCRLLKNIAKNDYKKIINLLTNLKIIFCNYSKVIDNKKERSTIYQLYDLPVNYYLIDGNNKGVYYNINKSLLNDSAYDALINTEIYFNDAFIAEMNNFKSDKSLSSRLNTLINFAIGNRFYNKGHNVDRHFSDFTNMSKVSKQFLHYNNQPYYECDIKNCQPLLLPIYLSIKNLEIDQSYIDNCCNGTFYESLMLNEQMNDLFYDHKKNRNTIVGVYNLYNRKDIKNCCYRFLLFGKINNKKNKFIKNFKRLYPLVYNSLIKLNEDKTFSLAQELQNIEASIMLNIISELNIKCPYYTVHDSISILDKSYIEQIKEFILNKIKILSNNKISNVIFQINETTIQTSTNIFTESIYDEKEIYIQDKKPRKEHKQHKLHIHNKKPYYDEVINMLNQNINIKDIASQLELSKKTIYNIKNNIKDF